MIKATTKCVVTMGLDLSRRPISDISNYLIPIKIADDADLAELPGNVADEFPRSVSLPVGGTLEGEILLKSYTENNCTFELWGDFGDLHLEARFAPSTFYELRIVELHKKALAVHEARTAAVEIEKYNEACREETMLVLRLAAAICNRELDRCTESSELKSAMEYLRDHLADDIIRIERGDKLPL